MATAFDNVAEQARALSASDRLRLATELLQSVGLQTREEAERAWEKEIERRISAVDSGNARGRSWDEIKRDFDSRDG